jgi:hypothetical protein
MRTLLCVSGLVVALAVVSSHADAAQPVAATKIQPAVLTGNANASPIQNVAWRRYAYRPYYGGYAYRSYPYRVYRPYYNGGYYGGYYQPPYYYGGYYPPYYSGYNYAPYRYGWRRGGAYYW